MTAIAWRSTVAALRETPPLLIAQELLRQIPFRPFDVGKLCFLRFAGAPQVPRSRLRGPGLIRRGVPADLEGLVQLRQQRDVFLARFAEGDHCVVAEVEGQLVGYEWFSDQAVHHEGGWGCRIAVPAGLVYAYDAYIDPSFRNAGIWLRFKAYLGDLMTESGKRGVLTFVDYGNWQSLRAHLRFGFTPAATVLATKILGWRMFLNLDTMELSRSSGLVSCDEAISVVT